MSEPTDTSNIINVLSYNPIRGGVRLRRPASVPAPLLSAAIATDEVMRFTSIWEVKSSPTG